MTFSIHNHPRQASTILFMSFISGYLIFKISLINYFSIESLLRAWLIICVLPLFIIAYIQNPNKKDRKNLNPINNNRIKSKIVIILLQLMAIYLYSFLITQTGFAWYSIFVDDLFLSLPAVIIFTIFYVRFIDRRLLEPEDDYAKIGKMLNREIAIDKVVLKKFLLMTLVKAVFIPFMYTGFLGNLSILLNTTWHLNVEAIGLLLFNFGVTIDMLIGIFGYLFSSAIINNKIVDTDSNILGWVFALLCYPPLFWIMHRINEQQDSLIWSDIVPNSNPIFWIIFITINITWVIYWLATFEFGMTFSNLSYRRLISTGVYRYTKHPAYISKNLYWWLYTLPFMGVTFVSAEWWKNILGLTFVSLVYYGRAKSEERHLMKFPEYQAYYYRIEKKGIFRWLKANPTY